MTHTIMNYIKGFTLSTCLLLLVSACSLSGADIPDDHYYRLPDTAIDFDLRPDAKEKINRLLIRPVQARGLYHERSMLYVEAATPLELRRYHYHYWVEAPADLVEEHIKSALGSLGISTENVVAIPVDSRLPLLSTRILGFERLVDGSEIQVLVRLEMNIRYGAQPDKGWTRQYQAIVPVASQSMHDTAAAFGRALDQLLAEFFQDLFNKV